MSESNGEVSCELTTTDVEAALKMFDILDQAAAAIDGVMHVEIRFKCGSQSDTIIIGYGENALPAIVSVIPFGGEDDGLHHPL